MPPKKATTGTTAAKKAPAEHPTYLNMIKEACAQLKERNGSSRQALKKYVKSNFKGLKEDSFDRLFNSALSKGVKAGELVQPKGPSGPVKLQKKDATKAPKPAKAAGEKKKSTTTKKATSTTKKSSSTTKAPKAKASTAAKPAKATTANSKKSRTTTTKAAAADKPLTKTKTGRVAKPKATPKKKAAASASTKKSATPKKSKKADAPAAAASAEA